VVEAFHETAAFHRSGTSASRSRRLLRKAVHLLAYHLVLKRERTTVTHAAGFRLLVRPTVFHPRYFITSEFLAAYVDRLDLAGARVADIGTGSGILALAAARAGATDVVALDINPNAASTASDNARSNGLGARVRGVCSNLFAALAPRPLFDVILSNPPYFAGEPRDLADRAWHGGLDYRHIASLFAEARERLAPGGRIYLVLSSHADLDHLAALYERSGFRGRLVDRRWIVIESLLIYELRLE
jgi:methylase of polypeptide subunit release factors